MYQFLTIGLISALAVQQGPDYSTDAAASGAGRPPVLSMGSSSTQTPLTTVMVASGLTSPVQLLAAPGDGSRLFIVEQYTGAIRMVKNGALLPTPFLSVATKIDVGGEKGLLGMAFHPNYASNGYFYINYTSSPSGATRIERYKVSAQNPDVADAASAYQILTIAQPYANHNGGMMAFGPLDGYLYIGMGDGGGDYDPNGNGQNLGSKLGKMLRIDVNTPGGVPYAIPPSNPFVGIPFIAQEIWAYGLRNPWRFSFDRYTGDLWIADVGQGDVEEVDFQPFFSPGGENYGWNCYEGNMPNQFGSCPPEGMTWPIYQYLHSQLPGCAIIGGFVYRGYQIPDLRGAYFFAEWCKSKIFSFRYSHGEIVDFQNRTQELQPPGGQYFVGTISSFGEDAAGELYLVNYVAGEVYQIVPQAPVVEGLDAWGVGTPGCSGGQTLTANASPIVGNPAFKIRCTNGAPNSVGMLLTTDNANYAGGDLLGIGVETYPDIFNITEAYFWDMPSLPDGSSAIPVPIPNNPTSIGKTYTFQCFWHWLGGNCQTPPGAFSSSTALNVTILP
jgi:glucose/arabinose dehydrogenase